MASGYLKQYGVDIRDLSGSKDINTSSSMNRNILSSFPNRKDYGNLFVEKWSRIIVNGQTRHDEQYRSINYPMEV